jgi:hypothetical protein
MMENKMPARILQAVSNVGKAVKPKLQPVAEATAAAVATRIFVLDNETKGAVRYHEVDEAGNPVTIVNGLIGPIYLRKDKLMAVSGSEIPQTVTVTITF